MTPEKVCAIPTDRFAMPAHPDYPKLRAGTELDAIYERLVTRGYGFHRPGTQGLPVVVTVFDCQCSWSHAFWEMSKVLENDIDFYWFPVCVSADISTAQGASILTSSLPWETMNEHQLSFVEGGLECNDYPATQTDRDRVWENARIFRKAGGMSVPLAIWRSPQNQFIPFFGDTTAEEIRRTVLIRKIS
ncbi:MAG: hypothetical protein Q4E62_04725 [Sutterellaceae bacterium]|nr:hypothetical protein [Sutterellaceae bacterium]